MCHRRLDRRPQVTAASPLGGEAAGQGTAPQHAGEAARAGLAAGPVEGLGRFNPDEAGTQRTPTASAPQRLASSSTGPLHPRLNPRLATAAPAQQRLLKNMCAHPATCPVVTLAMYPLPLPRLSQSCHPAYLPSNTLLWSLPNSNHACLFCQCKRPQTHRCSAPRGVSDAVGCVCSRLTQALVVTPGASWHLRRERHLTDVRNSIITTCHWARQA